VYAGTSRESVPKVVSAIVKELRRAKQEGVPPEELRRAKDQLKGSLMLSLESSTARMSNLARQEMYFGRFFTMDEIIDRIEGVSDKDMLQFADEHFRPEQIAVTVLGNLAGVKLSRQLLAC
jgi:predicted Zn-dependent peptidase